MKKIRSTNHKITAALLVAVMMLSVIFTAVFGGDMKTDAAPKTYTYCYEENSFSEFFTVTGNTTTKSNTINGVTYNKGLKLESKTGKIVFTPTQAGTLKVYVVSATTLSINSTEKDVSNNIYEEHYTASETEVGISKGTGAGIVYKVTYTLDGDSSGSSTESTQPSTSTTYTVSVVNGTVNGETLKSGLNNGESVTIEADKKDNFAYWLNSSNKIVSTDTSYTFNVYFSDTYTAVYNDTTSKKVVFMTAYGQEYTTVPYDESFSMPKVPARYGYTNGVWKKNAEDIATEFENNEIKIVKVNPTYEVNSTTMYSVKIDKNTKVVGATDTENEEYRNIKKVPANTIITVTTDKDRFTYWNDNKSGNKVSYNKTYSFYVNADMSLVPKSDDSVEITGAIRPVNVVTNDDGNTEIIYEFTVPDGCSIQFAGIVADTDKDKANDKDAKYKGGRASSATTFKYTVTVHKNMVNKLYVKPILKYLDANGVLQTIDNVDAALASTIK